MVIVKVINYYLQFLYITVLKPKANELLDYVNTYENSK